MWYMVSAVGLLNKDKRQTSSSLETLYLISGVVGGEVRCLFLFLNIKSLSKIYFLF